MGDDPSTSVCNQWGQTWDVDNLYVMDGGVCVESSQELYDHDTHGDAQCHTPGQQLTASREL